MFYLSEAELHSYAPDIRVSGQSEEPQQLRVGNSIFNIKFSRLLTLSDSFALHNTLSVVFVRFKSLNCH